MFYQLTLTKAMDVHPRHFGKNLSEIISARLIEEVEGTCHGKYGYVIAVTNMISKGQGVIKQDASGYAAFNVQYGCIVCRPFVGEVIDCIVTQVLQMGFFAMAGPVNVFVTSGMISEEYEYNTNGEPSFISADGSSRIAPRTLVRVRIVGSSSTPTELNCIASMKDDYLGVIHEGM
ncbi:MAG: hypothetical protein WDW38_006213 [Sanguina aurantia]